MERNVSTVMIRAAQTQWAVQGLKIAALNKQVRIWKPIKIKDIIL